MENKNYTDHWYIKTLRVNAVLIRQFRKFSREINKKFTFEIIAKLDVFCYHILRLPIKLNWQACEKYKRLRWGHLP